MRFCDFNSNSKVGQVILSAMDTIKIEQLKSFLRKEAKQVETRDCKPINTTEKSESDLLLKTELRTCTACGEPIADKYLFDVDGCSWHGSCLRCSVCLTLLERQPSCYFRDRQVYCRSDYAKTFGAKCSKCSRTIAPSDWVRKARDLVFHLACFSCDTCGRQLSTGEQFALIDDKVMCKIHYMDNADDSNSSDDGCSTDGFNKNKSKRVRTTFTEEQLHILQANFQIDSNPDGQDLERIAQLTGLSKRVTQVWFQNSRARQKKHTHVPRDHSAGMFNALRQDLNNNSNTSLSDNDSGMGKPTSMFNPHVNLINLMV